jgi:hypothetical protein
MEYLRTLKNNNVIYSSTRDMRGMANKLFQILVSGLFSVVMKGIGSAKTIIYPY